MLVEDFNKTIDQWINTLRQYSFGQLCATPGPSAWSLGQVYVHLISQTNYFVAQISICNTTNNNVEQATSPAANKMFLNNAFPNAIIEGPPSNGVTPQPFSKQQLEDDLMQLKRRMNTVTAGLGDNTYRGKTRHPGLGYFNAAEWLQFAEMHLRHHFRQKERIDVFLGGGKSLK